MKIHLHPDTMREVLAAAKENGDEFVIVAFKDNSAIRFWTRNSLEVAKIIADSSIERAGFVRALVWNVFGGNVSWVLYTAGVP